MIRKKFLVSTHLLLLKENDILLYLRKWGNQDKMYNLIAGHLDWWETPIEATIREVKEEANIDIKKEDLEFSHVSYSYVSENIEYIQFYFLCKKWEWNIENMELDRCYKMEFFPIKKLPKNITPYISKEIWNFLKGEKYNEYIDL